MENQTVNHITINGRYRIVFEKAAGVKTGDGFKVEANSDDLEEAQRDALALYQFAKDNTKGEDNAN